MNLTTILHIAKYILDNDKSIICIKSYETNFYHIEENPVQLGNTLVAKYFSIKENQDLKHPISHIRLDLIGILQCATGYLTWDEIKPCLEHIYSKYK